jgi:hypothetical protein
MEAVFRYATLRLLCCNSLYLQLKFVALRIKFLDNKATAAQPKNLLNCNDKNGSNNSKTNSEQPE